MKKGFTLIELLAVIVILAVIALIATPIVLSIIEETKESAVLRSAEHYLSAVELGVAKKNLTAGGSFSPNTCEVQSDGNLLCDGTETLNVEVSGEVPSSGTITFEKGKIISVKLNLSNKEIWKDPFTGSLTYELAPGLYDENDRLLLSWEELEEEYNLKTLIETDWNFSGDNATTIIDSIDGASKLVINESVTRIGYHSFYECKNLKSVIIPNSVTSIDGAFENCTGLTSITIPNSVTKIGTETFWGCTSLRSITIPESVTIIEHDAFPHSGLESITIPSNVTSIGSFAFNGCKNLKSVTIPSSVTRIESEVFDSCDSLTSINYRGTEEEWNAIRNDSTSIYGSNGEKLNIEINYNFAG